jgi:hypothetical protein
VARAATNRRRDDGIGAQIGEHTLQRFDNRNVRDATEVESPM